MTELTRRRLTAALGWFAAGATAPGLATAIRAQTAAPSAGGRARPKVVIVGGGAGGGTLAHVLQRGSPQIEVTLIEPQKQVTTCFFSNLYFGGVRTLESLTHTYDGLRQVGVNVLHDSATDIDAQRKTVKLRGGATLAYDRLVLAPGIEFKFEVLPGFSQDAVETMPHAWKGGSQTQLLGRQLVAMPDGGVVVMAVPAMPYRCPPGPYERACMIAHYLKARKPRSKLIILDAKKTFSKEGLFKEAFEQHYKGIVELHLTTDIDNHGIKQINTSRMEIETLAGKKVRAAVANVIPPQSAGEIAVKAGCTEGDWCPIEAENCASTKVKDVYVIGDAALAGDMPKSAFSANSQAKVVANDLEATLANKTRFPTRYRNTCWSLLSPHNSVKIGASYRPKGGKISALEPFVSKAGEGVSVREQSFRESVGWYSSIVAESFNSTAE